jgi:phosphatidylserine/phosphatidylglycerophosphate/cardiolipin synthase-like enzyme
MAMNLYPAVRSASQFGFVPGNQVTLLQNGDAYFPAIEQAFDQARFEIFLETYIFENDATGQRIAAALKRAVLRGVSVYVVKAFGASLAHSLKVTVAADSQQIQVAHWNQQSIGLRFVSWLCYGLLRLMTEISGYDLERSPD